MYTITAETDFLGKAKKSIQKPQVLYSVIKKSVSASLTDPMKEAKARVKGFFKGGKRMAAALRVTAKTQKETGNISGKIFASVKYKHPFVKIKGRRTNFAAVHTIHEYGKKDGSLPARPFLKPQFYAQINQVLSRIDKELDERIDKYVTTGKY